MFSCVRLFETPWTAAYQAPPSMGFFQARGLEWDAIAFSDKGILLSHKKRMPFAATWMDLEIIILSKSHKDKGYTISLIFKI